MGELLARVRVVLRRSEPQITKNVLSYRELTLDQSKHRVTLSGKEITLTPTEFDILTVLMQNAGVVVTHHQLIRQVWGPGYDEDSGRLIRVNISNLRRKLESDPNRPTYILTELVSVTVLTILKNKVYSERISVKSCQMSLVETCDSLSILLIGWWFYQT
jgi:two-component system KDP operon response regulator KdpE